MARKERADSAAAQVKVMAAATRSITPPASVPLADEDLVFFVHVVAEFARVEWTDHQLEMAALLARTMADLEREQRLLRSEGSVLISARGTPVINRRKTVVQMHTATILSVRRSLALHARAQGGEARDVGRRRRIAKDAEEDSPLEDDLLARPG